MTEQQQLDRIVDDVLRARQNAALASESLLVELLDMVLLAAAQRLIEAEVSGAEPAIFFGGATTAAAGSGAKRLRKLRRRSAH